MLQNKRSNLSDVRKANCKLIFDTLYKRDGMTLLEMEQSTELSRPTVVGMVRAMEEAGLIRKLGKRESNGGRTPYLYGINAEAYYALGIDFEFPVSRVVVSDMKGNIIGSSRKEFLNNEEVTVSGENSETEFYAEEVIEGLLSQIEEVICDSGVKKERLLGIGMGMPGYIDLKKGISVRFERISDWKNIDIVKRITEGTGLPVFMENDVHLLFRAEQELWDWEQQDTLFVAIRSGIGSAIFQRGHLIEGEYGNAGYIGHTVIEIDGPKCTCGNYGCLELYASERAIRKNYEKASGVKCSTVEEIVKRALSGDETARMILQTAGKYLGAGIGNAVNMLDINRIIVSADFDCQILLQKAQQVLDQRINCPQGRNAKIYLSRLSEMQFALGGCQLVFSRNRYEILSAVPLKNI